MKSFLMVVCVLEQPKRLHLSLPCPFEAGVTCASMEFPLTPTGCVAP